MTCRDFIVTKQLVNQAILYVPNGTAVNKNSGNEDIYPASVESDYFRFHCRALMRSAPDRLKHPLSLY